MHCLARTLMLLSLLLLAACDSGSSSRPDRPEPPAPPADPEFDFTAVDQRMQQFLDEEAELDGISYILVERDMGVIHTEVFGDHSPGLITWLASGSKMPAASLFMVLELDDSIDFDMRTPIGDYLPYEGVYGEITVEQMLSNTSGLPGLLTMLEAPGVYFAHACQFLPDVQLSDCTQTLFSTEVPGVVPPETAYNYGGSAWQMAGGVAEAVTNSTWAQAWDAYIATPCELDTFVFGNMWARLLFSPQFDWAGDLDDLSGRDNPNIEGGAVTDLEDYASLLLMHLNEGRCGDEQVLSADAVQFMLEDRGGEFGTPYGLGWFIYEVEQSDGAMTTVYVDPGMFGDVSWIDLERGIGGYIAIDRYVLGASVLPFEQVLNEVIAVVAEEVDRARAEVGQ